MQTKQFGPTGIQLPVFGQGTWHIEHDAGAVEALRKGLDAGLTHIDTAEMYGSGRAEKLIGEAIAGRRDELFLASKVLPSNASLRGTLKACEQSLKRLGTDHLDLYLLHWPGSHPLEDTVDALEQLVDSGKIRHWGVSNFAANDLQELLSIAGPNRIACNQILYHCEERTVEREVIPICRQNGIAVVAYSPFGSGDFPSSRQAAGKALSEIARERGVSPYQVALRFLVRHEHVFAIPKASTLSHLQDNAAAGDWQLEADEIARLDAACPPPRRMSGIPML